MCDFHRCIDFILVEEGDLVDHPKDPGGLTKFGISQRAYKHLDIAQLTMEDAKRIYRHDYWSRIQGDELAPGFGLVVLDHAINAGVSRAAILLQHLGGTPDDGIVGPVTLAALDDLPSAQLIDAYSRLRLGYYQACSDYRTFGRGWSRRVERIRKIALTLALAPAPTHPETRA